MLQHVKLQYQPYFPKSQVLWHLNSLIASYPEHKQNVIRDNYKKRKPCNSNSNKVEPHSNPNKCTTPGNTKGVVTQHIPTNLWIDISQTLVKRNNLHNSDEFKKELQHSCLAFILVQS
jgi:hypothetical protein